jgi:transcriptional regulator with XRE-family HTH domain
MSMTVSDYRAKLGLTLEAFARQFGKSKGHFSQIENANRAPVKLALAIEAHSNGLVDAATLNDDIAQARRVAA